MRVNCRLDGGNDIYKIGAIAAAAGGGHALRVDSQQGCSAIEAPLRLLSADPWILHISRGESIG